MTNVRTLNILGAFALSVADDLQGAVVQANDYNTSASAALITLNAHPGETIDLLSKVLELSHSGTVRLVDRLESDGLVERRRGSDGRSAALFVTAKGEQQVRDMLTRREEALREILGALSVQEQTQLTILLEKLLSGLTRSCEHARNICRFCDESVCSNTGNCPVARAVIW
ncbi:MAG: MarR family transcriptional regulator [Iphinoe sp. HA4291-MV1]|nr:MarR family transcriptional regulator [Iphinoe sp. HA4291-MV1]